MFRINMCVALPALVLVALVAQPAAADVTIYSEDFESMTPGGLVGQGGWTSSGTDVWVDAADHLSGQSVSGDASNYSSALNRARHALGSLSQLDPAQVYTLDWNAYAHGPNAGQQLLGSRNSAFGFVDSNPAYAGVAGWWADAWADKWTYDIRDITGGTAPFSTVSGDGIDEVVSLRLVIDGPNNQIKSYYDFGGGMTLHQTDVITDAQIQSIIAVGFQQDTRGDSEPAEYDNLLLTVVPEPSTLAMLSGLAGLILAWRKR
ncbi:MAG: PEP-CTERM sorting domain-containing protein [Planctomycetota bacterium]|nr:PEP-CTERM sorting domain-containing protein [Planctomycetota bacterium]